MAVMRRREGRRVNAFNELCIHTSVDNDGSFQPPVQPLLHLLQEADYSRRLLRIVALGLQSSRLIASEEAGAGEGQEEALQLFTVL